MDFEVANTNAGQLYLAFIGWKAPYVEPARKGRDRRYDREKAANRARMALYGGTPFNPEPSRQVRRRGALLETKRMKRAATKTVRKTNLAAIRAKATTP